MILALLPYILEGDDSIYMYYVSVQRIYYIYIGILMLFHHAIVGTVHVKVIPNLV